MQAVTELARRLGKLPVAVGDRPGFVADGLLFGYLNQAAAMYEAKYASREDIDAAMRLGCGLPMGPLALLDLIGLDTAYEILDTMYKQGRDRLHAPAPILKQMVTAGMLGRIGALLGVASMALSPLGPLIGGLLAGRFGGGWALVAAREAELLADFEIGDR